MQRCCAWSVPCLGVANVRLDVLPHLLHEGHDQFPFGITCMPGKEIGMISHSAIYFLLSLLDFLLGWHVVELAPSQKSWQQCIGYYQKQIDWHPCAGYPNLSPHGMNDLVLACLPPGSHGNTLNAMVACVGARPSDGNTICIFVGTSDVARDTVGAASAATNVGRSSSDCSDVHDTKGVAGDTISATAGGAGDTLKSSSGLFSSITLIPSVLVLYQLLVMLVDAAAVTASSPTP
jgi:hypothetical protein